MLYSAVITIAVTVSMWMTPMPQHSAGWIVNYGPRTLGQDNAIYRGYDHTPYKCLGSLMSPADLGQIFWLKTPSHPEWYGPCLSVDAGQRLHFAQLVFVDKEIAEIDTETSTLLGFTHGMRGEIWVGNCPPTWPSAAVYYQTDKKTVQQSLDYLDPTATIGYLKYFWPFPPQHFPVGCAKSDARAEVDAVTLAEMRTYVADLNSRPTRSRFLPKTSRVCTADLGCWVEATTRMTITATENLR